MKSRKLPVLLSREEALQHASRQLRKMAENYSLAVILMDALSDLPADDKAAEARAKAAELRTDVPEPAIQEAACKAAADLIDALLLEERIIAARMRSGQPA